MGASQHLCRKVLVLLSMAGLACALQYPLQYTYHYRARVTAGAPEVNCRQSATSELRADLVVYATSPHSLMFSLNNVETGEFHGEVDCDGKFGESVPMEYSRPTEEPGSLIGEHPFGVDDGELLFHANEKQWTINFYKSILSLFATQPMKETFFGMNTNYTAQPGAYRVEEDTIMGRCPVTYTQQRLTGVSATRFGEFIHHHVTEDIQRPEEHEPLTTTKTSGTKTRGRKTTGRKTTGRKTTTKTTPERLTNAAPALEDTVWKVIRTVNLEDCENPVEHQKTLQGISCKMAEGQCANHYSRNSHGVYYLRGDAKAYRIEKAIVRGAVQVSPYGYDTEHLINLSKQKLALVSVTNLDSNVPTLECTKTVSDLVYQMTLGYRGVYNPYSWAKLGSIQDAYYELTGHYVTEEQHAEKDAAVLQLVQLAYEEIHDITIDGVSRAPVMLNFAANMILDCTEEQVHHLVDHAKETLTAEALVLFYNVLAEVGTAEAVKAVLEGISAGRVTDVKQVAFFGTLNTNSKHPGALRPLLDFLKRENIDETPYRTTQSMINFATLVHRVCISDEMPDHSYAVFYKEHCDKENIVHEFEDLLFAKLETATKFWKQMTLVKALVNLNTVRTTNVLMPFILGAKECDTMVRAVALDTLASWYNSPAYYEKITLILLDMYENPAENRLIRARALTYLVSYPLSSTGWTRLAFSTRRPDNYDLAAFAYSIIKSVASYEDPTMINQRRMANHALVLAKPASPARRYSGWKSFMRYNFADEIGVFREAYVLWDPMSPIPAEMNLYFRRSLSEINLHYKSDTMLAGDDGDIENIARELLLGEAPQHSSSTAEGDAARLIDMLKGGLNIIEGVRGPIRGFYLENPMLGMEWFMPFDYEILMDLFNAISPSRSANDLVFEGPSSMYSNQQDHFFVTVNDLGMRVVMSLAIPTVFHMKGSMRFGKTGDHKYSMKSEGLGVMSASTVLTQLETYVAWGSSNVGAGVSFTSTYQSPLSVDYDQVLPNTDGIDPGISMSVKQSSLGKISIMNLANEPYTLLGATMPENFAGFSSMIKIINDPHVIRQDNEWRQDLPFHSSLDWEGDIPPMNKDVFDILHNAPSSFIKRSMSPTLRQWKFDWSAHFNDRGYDNEELTLLLTQSYAAGTGGSVSDITQQQSSADYFTQQQSSTDYAEQLTVAGGSRPSEGFGPLSEFTLAGFFKFLQHDAGWTGRVDGVTCRVELQYNGEETVMDVTVAQTLSEADEGRQKKSIVVGVTRKDDPCFTTCVEAETLRPKFSNMDTLGSLRQKNLRKAGTYKIYAGPNCKDGPLSVTHETRSLSAELYSSLFTELENCTDPTTDLAAKLARDALYDHVETSDEYFKDEDVKLSCGHNTLLSLARAYYQDIYRAYMPAGLVPSPCRADHDARIVNVTAQRDTYDGQFWTVRYSFDDSQDQTIKPLKVPDVFSSLVNTLALRLDYSPAQQCVIGEHSMTSFDGLTSNVTVEGCPAVAVTSCEAGQSSTFAVAVNKLRNGGLAVNLGVADQQLVLSMDYDGIQVNGRAIEADYHVRELKAADKVVGHIYHEHGVYKIQIDGTLEVVYKEGRVYIEVSPQYHGYTCGLCGDHDNEPYNDLKLPNGCLTSCPETFRKSWTPSGIGCPSFTPSGYDADSCTKEEALPQDYYAHYEL